MSETRMHPLDDNAPMSSLAEPTRRSSVSFHGNTTDREKESLSASDSQQPQTSTSAGSQLRNRLDGKPAPTSSVSAPQTVATSSNLSTDTPRPLQRRDTGPGGRLIVPENHEATPRWTTRASTYLQAIYAKYSPSLTLENKGSIARDHLANERTYLAWLRSSLSLITVGVAVTQLFRLQSTNPDEPPTSELVKVSELGRPLGGSFIALGIMFLWLGTSRYFHSQSVLSYGQFPASRGSIIISTVTVMAVLIACFIIVILQGRTN
ncbi:putative membrane protein [Entomortierella parvispora]|uniref:Membrane protein n=1 Tax=Entomortierella parvispora TaxID=205924 RepID=A0A9P3HA37_9FUNG|nr:putative membrane protein [Entomortierella parvispora]